MVKIRFEILNFAKEMEMAMAMNDTEKGNSWKQMEFDDLANLFWKKKEKIDLYCKNDFSKKDLVDLANYCMMLCRRMEIDAQLEML